MSVVAQSSGTGRFRRVFDSLSTTISIYISPKPDFIAYPSCVDCTLATSSSESPCPSTCIASPFVAAPPFTVILERASRASSLSLDSLVITRTAASCSYNARLSSCLVCVRCCRRVNVSSAKASHSFWKTPRSEGIEVSVGGRGRTVRDDFSSTKSSNVRSSPVTGSLPFSEM